MSVRFQEGLLKSDFFFIKGRKGTHRLLLPFWIAKIQGIEHLLVLSFENKTLYEKEIDKLEFLLDPTDMHYIQRSRYLTLKKSAEELKKKYGYELLLEEFKSIIEQFKPQMVVLYLFDLFFKVEDSEEIESFVSALFELGQQKSVKLIIVCDEENEYKRLLFGQIENYVDCQLHLIPQERQTLIEVESCLLPLERTQYRFGIENKNILLDSAEVEEGGAKQRILLLSENEYIVRFHRYIVGSEKEFSLIVAKDIAQIFEELLLHPDSLIYFEKEQRSDFEICALSKKYDLNILLFLNKRFVRKEDQIQALERGCAEVLPLDFNFEEYIATFQKDHRNFFYAQKISNLPDRKITTKEEFREAVALLLEKRIFFTLIKTNWRLDKQKLELLRSKDLHFQNESEVSIVVINVRKIHIEPILKKLHIDPKEATILEALEIEPQHMERFV